MGIKSFRPTTPTLRQKTVSDFDMVTTDKPYKPLLESKKRSSGRNNSGRIMIRHRGGGARRHYRIIDFKRNKFGIPGVVETIEYDPNRSAYIALVKYVDGERRYILATTNMKTGMSVMSGTDSEISEGNHMPLARIPVGTMIHNIELRRGKGGQIGRGAGTYAEVVAKEENMVQIKLPSSEIRNVGEYCMATIGQVSNVEYNNIIGGSAGKSRHLNKRPHVRGVAMNPVDHPMGGGEGKASGGGHPVTPWGKKTKGLKTRKNKKASDKLIVKRRKKKS
ncbi:MAG: 50S ribosomal protein L2 [Chitinivibrionales bacterium]|nr:50S ribosomal protein L2 [Chitinivibrionales bacterium]